MIESRRSQRDEPHALRMKRLQHLFVQVVIHERAHSRRAGCQRTRRRRQPRFEVLNVMAVRAIGLVEELAIEPVRAEECDAHDVSVTKM